MYIMKRLWSWLWIALFGSLTVVYLVGCYTVPVTGRSALNFVNPDQLAASSLQAFSDMKSQIPASRNAQRTDQVQRVGHRIANAVSDDMPNAQWEFVLFDDPQVNAFAMPGGKIGIFEGLYQVAQTEEDLAFVMAHEAAHVTAQHSAERISQQMAMQLGGTLALAALFGAEDEEGNPRVSNDMQAIILASYNIGSGLVGLHYSREQEEEADHIGLMYMSDAGYDPRGAPAFWDRMAALSEGNRQPTMLSTHPQPEARRENLLALMPEAIERYMAAQARGIGK